MVKFGMNLQEERIEKWLQHYIDYKSLKQIINKKSLDTAECIENIENMNDIRNKENITNLFVKFNHKLDEEVKQHVKGIRDKDLEESVVNLGLSISTEDE